MWLCALASLAAFLLVYMNTLGELAAYLLWMFGVMGVMGYTEGKRYASRDFWKGYLVVLLYTILALCVTKLGVFGPEVERFGNFARALVIAFNIPLVWAVYSYAFQSPGIWSVMDRVET
jgi:hypothetical protein